MLTILQGDAIEQLHTLPDESVHCCVTSPPYWGLRDYSTNGQLGLEKTPEEYVAKMVEVFREVRRVLRKDGTLWLNLGDSYAARGGDTHTGFNERWDGTGIDGKQTKVKNSWPKSETKTGLKPKDLCGIPWRVAFALQADGWYLRQDIIWAKPNPMPESVTDRCTKAHEYIFLLTKSAQYFYDAEAIKEKAQFGFSEGALFHRLGNSDRDPERGGGAVVPGDGGSRNKRSVWTVATAPYPEAHFATYPPDLIKPCILAGTSAKGCCAKCGSPWERIVEKTGGTIGKSWHNHDNDLGRGQRGGDDGNVAADAWAKGDYKVETIGWQPTCKCAGHKILEMEIGQSGGITELLTEPVPVHTIPCTVLDPFAGSGTTGAVALELGRKAVLIELNPKYVELIEKRCNVTMGLALA